MTVMEEYSHGHHVPGLDLSLVIAEERRETPVGDLGLHGRVQHDVSSFDVPMGEDGVWLFV